MNEDMKRLFTPFQIGKVVIKNRLCMGPMGIAHMQGLSGEFGDNVMEYFVERARGGFGLITIGVQNPDMKVDPFDPKIQKSPLYNPSLYCRQANKLVEKVSAFGTKIFAQISMGYGRNQPGQVAPSAIESYYEPDVLTKEMTKEQIRTKIEQMAECAKLMKRAGFHGVEIHAMHWGYLLDQFAMAYTNHRTDEYGGSLDNRLRVCKEIIDAIHEGCGEDYPVTMRIAVKSYMKGFHEASLTGEEEVGRTLEEGVEICRKLEEMGYAALSVDTGTYDSFYYACPPSYVPRGYALELYQEVKKAVSIPVMAGSRMGDPVICAKALEEGQADAFVFSRPALADPDFARKIELGVPEKIRPCIGCNMGCVGKLIDQGMGATCAVNPRAMREMEYLEKRAVVSKNIMIIGGGVAGMEAARLGAHFGHNVELYEKSDVLGGEMLAAGGKPLKTEVDELNAWYQLELKDLGVPLHMNTEVTAQMVKEKKPDMVILAIGAVPVMPRSIPGIDHKKAVASLDALTGKKPVGDTVVVVGGGEVGCEAAVRYVLEGKKVMLVEALSDIMSVEFVPNQHRSMLKDMIQYHGIELYTSCRLVEINDDGALIESADGQKKQLQADTIILSIGLRQNMNFASELAGTGIEVQQLGSGKKLGNIYTAVHDAYDLMYNL